MGGPSIAAVEANPVVVPGLRDFRISEGRTRTHISNEKLQSRPGDMDLPTGRAWG